MAAYKHVPFGEEFPEETFAVNVLATDQLLKLAAERGIRRLVYPSSDKAVHPPSLYGATKRVSETLAGSVRAGPGAAVRGAVRHPRHARLGDRDLRGAGRRRPGAHDHRRGDDATGSACSEAIWLVVQAAAIGAPASVLMLDVTDEVPILTIARRVEALAAPGRPSCRSA